MRVVDNFLPDAELHLLRSAVLTRQFEWYYVDDVNFEEGICNDPQRPSVFQFVHPLFIGTDQLDVVLAPSSHDDDAAKHDIGHLNNDGECPHLYLLGPVLRRLDIMELVRAKMNLGVRDPSPRHAAFHSDYPDITTAVFYLNTTDGYTEFADGTTVAGIGNRLVEFDSNIEHTGVTHTDEQVRLVLNLNYRTGVPVAGSTATV
jgi:hypothetical protein